MKLYDKIVNLAKGKGVANANQIMKQCNIATNTWYNFRRTDKLSEATKERLALGLGISTGDINALVSEALGEELKAKGEIRPGEPNKKASEPAVEKEELPEAIQEEEEIPADDGDARLEAAIEEVTRYLPKEPEKNYYQRAKEEAEQEAMKMFKKVALEKLCKNIDRDMKDHLEAFYEEKDIEYLREIQKDILPAWIRAEEELEEYDE